MAIEKIKIRYRRVSTRMWNDRKFLDLSAPKPNARDLWIWLLTGPLTTPVPGIVLASLGGMAEGLDWPLVATKRCWVEITASGMAKADWSRKPGLVWLPNALRHNPPANPNVVVSWRQFLNECVPECALRVECEGVIEVFLEGKGQAFLKAFREETGKGFGKQDQDQDQEDPPQPPAAAGGRLTRKMLAAAEQALRDFRASQPRYVFSAQREPGVEYPDPKHCPHEPECTDDAICVARIATAERDRVAIALAQVAS
jgi:hypothetical protein